MNKTQPIEKDIKDLLRSDSRIDASNIDVSVADHKAKLSGTVESYEALIAARDITRSVFGVRDVINDLQVSLATVDAELSDSQIRTRILQKLNWNSEVDPGNIELELDDGKVILKGTVDSYWAKASAETGARKTRGVVEVDDQLVVTPTETVSDEILAERIIDRLKTNAVVDLDDIDIRIRQGKVVLSGEVSSRELWNSIFNVVRYTVGVTDIDNSIEVK